MQAIAEENNLAETAFFVPSTDGFHIRWFTPNCEVKLCGHATLAAAYVLFYLLAYEKESITFQSLSGPLSVSKSAGLLTLDFPAQPPHLCHQEALLGEALGIAPLQGLANEDYLAVYESQEQLASIQADYARLMALDYRGVIATAPSEDYDFVVRFFAPKAGINEDSVTGSAFTQLVPYWAKRLGKSKLKARQISARGGNVHCQLLNDRVLISGSAVSYLQGQIEIN